MPQTKSPAGGPSNPRPATEEAANGAGGALEVLTLAETAAYFRVDAEDVLRMVAAEGLPARQFGKEWRFLKTALQSWLSVSSRKKGLVGQLGKIKDDPYLHEMLQDIYARRGRPETAES